MHNRTKHQKKKKKKKSAPLVNDTNINKTKKNNKKGDPKLKL
jgi:hypothetical protein